MTFTDLFVRRPVLALVVSPLILLFGALALSKLPIRQYQFNQQNAATLQTIPAPGVSMGEAVAFLERQANELSAEFSHDWQGDSRQYTQEGSALEFAFLAALVIIYLVLAAQYESLKDPLIILITVPLSICGALLPLVLGYATMNIYTLVGLISKHGILMVEFANELQMHQGLARRDFAGGANLSAAGTDDHRGDGVRFDPAIVCQQGGCRQPLRSGAGDRLRHAGGHAVYLVRVADGIYAAGARSCRGVTPAA